MSDQTQTMTVEEARGLQVGEIVIVHVACEGADSQDVERTHPAGTEARVLGLRVLPAPQGLAVTLEVGEAENERIVVVFDESDDCGYAFTRASNGSGFTAEPRMESAGAEIMALSFRLEGHPEFADDAARLREIAAWASVERMTDMHWAFLDVLGSMMGAMRRRNFAFSEDRSISTQFAEFLDGIPDPLPGDAGYVDPATLYPLDRRDEFDAVVTTGTVRRWTDAGGTRHALADDVAVAPDGKPGRSIVHAQGDMVDLLVRDSKASLRLKATGGALRIVGPAKG